MSHSNDHLTAIRRRERAPSTTSIPDLSRCSNVRGQNCRYSITSSARASSVGGIVNPSALILANPLCPSHCRSDFAAEQVSRAAELKVLTSVALWRATILRSRGPSPWGRAGSHPGSRRAGRHYSLSVEAGPQAAIGARARPARLVHLACNFLRPNQIFRRFDHVNVPPIQKPN